MLAWISQNSDELSLISIPIAIISLLVSAFALHIAKKRLSILQTQHSESKKPLKGKIGEQSISSGENGDEFTVELFIRNPSTVDQSVNRLLISLLYADQDGDLWQHEIEYKTPIISEQDDKMNLLRLPLFVEAGKTIIPTISFHGPRIPPSKATLRNYVVRIEDTSERLISIKPNLPHLSPLRTSIVSGGRTSLSQRIRSFFKRSGS